MNPCEKCGYRHGRGRCCIDIYQQLGRTEGPSILGKVLLAFVLPILVFTGSVIGAEFIATVSRGRIKCSEEDDTLKMIDYHRQI